MLNAIMARRMLVWSVVAVLLGGLGGCAGPKWRDELAGQLPLLGHRNWIVIADSAYPAQSRAGIETIATEADHFEVVEAVLKAVDSAPHVRAKVYLDEELKYVKAVGVEAYRKRLAELIAGHPTKYVPHEQLIVKLDEAAKLFNILILKTNLTIPYTSVFIELDCGYWDPQSEQELRRSMRR